MIIVLYFVHFALRMRVYTTLNSFEEMQPEVLGHPEKFMPFSQVSNTQDKPVLFPLGETAPHKNEQLELRVLASLCCCLGV
eukprot:2020643-Amphidinium_carterae.1